jgi:hypothetical protein
MPGDPLGLQDNPLFGGISKLFKGLDSLKGSMNRPPKPGAMSPNYAQAMYAGEAANRGVAPAKSKGTATMKKPASKKAKPILSKATTAKDKSGKKPYAAKSKVKDSVPIHSTKAPGSVKKAIMDKSKSRPSSSGHATVAQDGKIKSRSAKGKAADKLVTMKKFVGKKQKV